MKPEQQIKALAELDGYDWNTRQPMMGGGWMVRNKSGYCWCDENYLTSYDAIIPLIQKQDRPTQIRMMKLVAKLFGQEVGWDATAAQLCEALLRSVGKWKE